jgi:molybdopterin adenylyltransferase
MCAAEEKKIRIGLVSVSDRASKGVYEDKGIPAMLEWLGRAMATQWEPVCRLIPDEQEQIEGVLRELVDSEGCCLVLTTGGTGPAPRDVTPDATLAGADRVLEGFGERMRAVNLQYAPTAILSRQVGVIRRNSLIINLPGQPKAIGETLQGIFSAVPYCIELVGGPYIETHEGVVKAHRPASAVKKKP